MKNKHLNTTLKTGHALDDNHYLWRSLISLGTEHTLSFNKVNAPPPTLQMISKTLTRYS